MKRYKLYKGDCLDILTKIEYKVDLILCDLPYGLTNAEWDKTIPNDKMWNAIKIIRKETTPILFFGQEPFASYLRLSNIKEYKYDWIWSKNRSTNFLNAKRQPLRNHENILVFYKKFGIYNPQKTEGHKPMNKYYNNSQGDLYNNFKGSSGGGQTDRYPTTIQYFPVINNDGSSKEGKFHPTQKPLGLLRFLIETYSNPNDIVLDFTMGSGSTGIASLECGRRFIGVEKNKDFYSVARNRIKSL